MDKTMQYKLLSQNALCFPVVNFCPCVIVPMCLEHERFDLGYTCPLFYIFLYANMKVVCMACLTIKNILMDQISKFNYSI